MRLNGVGIKKQGFIDRAYELALENGEFLPHWAFTVRHALPHYSKKRTACAFSWQGQKILSLSAVFSHC